MDEPTFVEGFHNPDLVKKLTYTQFGNTDMRISKLSLGGGPLAGLYGDVSECEAIETVIEALKSGVNYIDTAPWYGNGKSELVLGKALQKVPRKSFYIGTKVGRYTPAVETMFDFSREKVLKTFEESLKLLQLDYVDIIQVHDLEFAEDFDQVINETLPALQTLVEAGKARYIGVTGYPVSKLKQAIERSPVKISSVLSYARNTLIDDELKAYLPYFKENNLGIINACSVCMGLLTQNQPPAWHPAPLEIKEAAYGAAKYCKEQGSDLARVAVFHSISVEGIHTHLMGANSREIFKKNFATITALPTEKETSLARDVREKFFKQLKKTHWEGKDVEKYWRIMKMIRGEIPKTDEFDKGFL